MDLEIILPLVIKGVTLAQSLITADNIEAAEKAFEAVKRIITGFTAKAITQADLDAEEAILDALIDEFDVDLPAA